MYTATEESTAIETQPQRLGVRREARREGLRLLDYSEFPRVSAGGGSEVGLLIDESPSGLRFVANEAHEPGSLLRVSLRGLHGQECRDVVARVVWCNQTATGRCQLGLETVHEARPRMLRVRHQGGQRYRA